MNFRPLVFALLLCVSPRAYAQTATARGEALFKQGMELRNAGKTAEACDAFEASEKADPNLGTLTYLADCREANGQLTTAWSLFLEAEMRTRNGTDDESVQIHAVAIQRAAQLEPRLSKLTINVPAANRLPGLQIFVGNESLVASPWNIEFPVDGKTHQITARAPGYRDWTTTVTLAPEHDRKSIDIPALEKAPEPPKPERPNITIVAQPREERPFALRALPYAVAGAGVASFVGAIVFEGWSRGNYDSSKLEPEDLRQARLYDRAKAQRAKAIAFGAGGVACAGVAVWLFMRGSGDADTAPSHTIVQPVVSADITGLQLGGAW